MLFFLGRLGELPLGPLRRVLGLGQLGGRLLGGGPQAEQALSVGGAAPGPVRAQQVTVGGHDRGRRIGSHQLKAGRQIGHDQNAGQQPVNRRREFGRRRDKITSRQNSLSVPLRPGRAAPAAGCRSAVAGDDQVRAAGLAVPQPGQDRGGRVEVADRDRGGRPAERGGDRLGRAVGDGEQFGERAEHAREPAAVGQQHGRRVRSLPHRLLQGAGPGPQPGPAFADFVLGLAQASDLGRGLLDGRRGALAGRYQLGPVLVPAANVVLQLAVLLLSLLGPGPGRGQHRRQAAGFLLGRGDPAPGRAGLAAQPGQPLRALGGFPGVGCDLPFRLGQGSLGRRLGRHRRRELGAGSGKALAEGLLLLAEQGRLPLELVGVAARPGWLGRGGQVPVPLRGEIGHGSQPLRQPAK